VRSNCVLDVIINLVMISCNHVWWKPCTYPSYMYPVKQPNTHLLPRAQLRLLSNSTRWSIIIFNQPRNLTQSGERSKRGHGHVSMGRKTWNCQAFCLRTGIWAWSDEWMEGRSKMACYVDFSSVCLSCDGSKQARCRMMGCGVFLVRFCWLWRAGYRAVGVWYGGI
jgi:hypothetical protein